MDLPRLLRPARSRLAFLIPAVPVILAACNKGDAQSTFGTGGPIANTQANLYIYIFWLAVVVFVLVEGALVYSILRFRRGHNEEGLPAQIHGNNRLELIWTTVPVLILIAIAIPTIRTIYDQDGPPSNQGPVMDVKVRAHQWWWEVEYPGQDVVTANEIRIPVGQWVNFTLNSDDVIHSFWIPKLAGKVDIIPGDVRTLALRADKPGSYFGQCAEFCGEAHSRMRFRVIAEPAGDFQAWLDGMRRPPEPLVSQDALDGQQLFASNCSTCHSNGTWDGVKARQERTTQAARQASFVADPKGTRLIAAPNLTNFGTRSTLGAGLIPLTQENLEKWINNPNDVKQGNRMKKLAQPYRTNSLSRDDVRKLATYLLALKPVAPGAVVENGPDTAGTPEEHGKALFNANGCSGCHSTGSDRIVGPGLKGISQRGEDAYIRESILTPSAVVVPDFPDNVMPKTFGAALSADEINDLIAYLKTL